MTKINPETIYHIYNRSVLKIPLFRTTPDFVRFLVKIDEYKARYPIEILAFCLMPNHFHFLLREPEQSQEPNISNVSRFLQQLQNSYAKYFAKKYDHSGRVFQGVFKRKPIKNDHHLHTVIDYIHNNPVRKNLVIKAEDWPYSTAFYNNSHYRATDLKG